ncbi:MAG: glycosyltransferase [Acidobacteriaceae bacterium]|nr:glycosyltransferase [Acidobacteriaceae bacterium]
MSQSPMPRVAYFPDSFHEVNGVAHTSRNFAAFARRRQMPFLCVRAGAAAALECASEQWSLELKRSWASVALERDLYFDALFPRYAGLIESTLERFQPEVLHVTGPSELGIFGAYFAWKRNIPLVASWHTNVHEYAARRMRWFSRHLGEVGGELESSVEAGVLNAVTRFYRLAKVLYAPNPQLCSLLEQKTGTRCCLMQRGVETELFTPAKRRRSDAVPVLGYVGRLSVEKNVVLLPQIASQLKAMGVEVRFCIIGHGVEEALLRATMPEGTEFPGVLRGEALAEAYASMDLFVFPSHTDTFGNVVLEALASGVPAVVTPTGGPAHIVREGETGFVAEDAQFATRIAALLREPAVLQTMRESARAYALSQSWDAVFERVVAEYPCRPQGPSRTPAPLQG